MDIRESEDAVLLAEAILSLESADECFDFFEDLCTIKEILDITSRFKVARLLSEGRKYSEITALSSASSATIGRVNRCLNYGSGGYARAIARLNEKKASEVERADA